MVLIGIDPPKGMARMDGKTGRIISIETMDFWGIVEALRGVAAQVKSGIETAMVYIEAPQTNKPTFFHGQIRPSVREKISQNVGANKRDSVLLIELCQQLGLAVVPVPPRRKNSTKHSPEEFIKKTGWKQRCSEHGRDALMIMWGRSWQYDLAVNKK